MHNLLKLIDMKDGMSIDLHDLFNDKADEIMQLLIDNGIGVITNDLLVLKEDDKVRLAILALRSGIEIKQIAKRLSWKDFEMFASMILNEHGYDVYNSVRINRLEIDLIAINNDLALVIDCKHWKYNSNSKLKEAIDRQILRINQLLKSNKFDISYAIPLILTLHESLLFIDNIPIVPIEKFSSFINEFKGYLDTILMIKRF